MSLSRTVLRAALAGTLMIGAATLAAPPATAHPPDRDHHLRITTVVRGLDAPRGVTLDHRGNLYVAESGRVGSGDAGLTETGRVSKYRMRTWQRVWSTGFQSAYATEGPGGPDVLGPEGLSTTGRGCEHGGCPVSMIMSLSQKGIAHESGGALHARQAGHLFTLNRRTGHAHDRANVGDQNYRWTADHHDLFPDDFPDSNPYGVLVTRTHRHGHEHGYARHYTRTRTFVADAGANTVSEVMRNGAVRVIAYIPNETPPLTRDATPTCVAMGPDGMLYVGTLNIIAGAGQASVWRVDPDANYPTVPELWATGLTTITACAFDRHGDFWATEMFANNGPSAPPGDVVRVDGDHPTHQHRYGGGHLPLPGGLAVGRHGELYVSINSASPVPGSGAVVRMSR
ncbi:ScyD/ScyE family protein [Jatrophihabitans fulvus]